MNNRAQSAWIRGAVAIALAAAGQAAFVAQARDWWVSLNVRSDHYTHRATAREPGAYNTETLGIGVEVVISPAQSWLSGWYHNSHHKPSIYVALGEQPLEVGAFRAGGVIGLVSGYSAADVIPLAGLIVSYDGPRFGANVVVTPPVASWAGGSVSLQVKARADLLK